MGHTRQDETLSDANKLSVSACRHLINGSLRDHGLAPAPSTSIEFEGKTYSVTMNLPAIAAAESFFKLDLDSTLGSVKRCDYAATLQALRELLPCMLHAAHPDLEYCGIQEMIDRSLVFGNLLLVNAARLMFREPTAEQKAANDNLSFNLHELAEANEFFAGKSGLSGLCFGEALSVLDRACRVFPCAVHRFRPKLDLAQAQALMTWKSVGLIVDGFWEIEQRTSPESMTAFAARLWPYAPAEELEDCALRVIAKELAPLAAQA